MEILGMEPNWIWIRTVGKVGGKIEREKGAKTEMLDVKKIKKANPIWMTPTQNFPTKQNMS